jgi:ribonuclease-3
MLMGRGEERSGGRSRSRNLAAVIEAVLGAVFLDQGLEVARGIVAEWVSRTLANQNQYGPAVDPKSALQEVLQATRHESPSYEVLAEEGPPHARRYVVAVLVGDERLGQGEGSSKRRAEEAAARDALRQMPGAVS